MGVLRQPPLHDTTVRVDSEPHPSCKPWPGSGPVGRRYDPVGPPYGRRHRLITCVCVCVGVVVGWTADGGHVCVADCGETCGMTYVVCCDAVGCSMLCHDVKRSAAVLLFVTGVYCFLGLQRCPYDVRNNLANMRGLTNTGSQHTAQKRNRPDGTHTPTPPGPRAPTELLRTPTPPGPRAPTAQLRSRGRPPPQAPGPRPPVGPPSAELASAAAPAIARPWAAGTTP